MPRIDDELNKIASAIAKENTETSEKSDRSALPGDPDCEICGGIGFVRQDLPIDHSDFGRLQVCSCRARQVELDARRRLYRLSNLDAFKHLTFDTFNQHGQHGLSQGQSMSLESAFTLAKYYAGKLDGWLLLSGDYGCGKTHLAAAVANAVVELGVPTLFLTIPDLLDWLRFSYDSPETSFEQRFDEIRNIRLLVLDDLGTQNATPWAQEKLFQIINHRYVNRLPTVVTTNVDLQSIDGRISSRLKDDKLVQKIRITAPDYRQPTTDTTHPPLSSLHLHSRRTLGTFDERRHEQLSREQRDNLTKVHRIAAEYAEDPEGWIVLNGGAGTGKTHLAAGIGLACQDRGRPVMFVVVPDLLDHLRATFSPNSAISYDRLFNEVQTAEMLILDDLGTQSATPWAREKLYQILNYRYNAELPTVITTTDRLEDMDAHIRSRMMDTRLVRFLKLIVPPYLPTEEKPARRRVARK
ncbi:MAG TPA: ATP-binding protein [Levilinea sp.]|nr:ATP-binding protein [Levilinea sp.]